MEKSPILKNKVRENAGSIASNRFTYQVNWGVCKLISFYAQEDPYFLIMEMHEDAIICDDLSLPTYIDFYQIKTKKGKNWTIGNLTSKGKSTSIVSKMYHSKDKFKKIARKLYFRSDALFQIINPNPTNKGDSKKILDKFTCSDLVQKESNKIRSAIQDDYNLSNSLDINQLFDFSTEPIKYDNHVTTTIGFMSEFFNIKLDKPFKTLAYTFIAGEVLKRNNYEGSIKTNNDLKKLKAISKKDFKEWIAHCIKHIKFNDDTLAELKLEIKTAPISYQRRKSIIRYAEQYIIEIKSNDILFVKVSKLIKSFIGLESDDVSEDFYTYSLNIKELNKHKLEIIEHLEDDYLLAAIMYELTIL